MTKLVFVARIDESGAVVEMRPPTQDELLAPASRPMDAAELLAVVARLAVLNAELVAQWKEVLHATR